MHRASWHRRGRAVLTATTVVVAVLASAIVAMGATTLGVSVASAGVSSNKAAFCGANDAIDRASANVTSDAGFLAVLKSHTNDLAVMKKDAPPGSLGQLARELVSAAEAALASDNASALNNLPDGAAIDTYCGVDGNGNRLPSYFGAGKTSAFCAKFVPIYVAVGNASNNAGVLAALTSHQAQISQLASELSTLPKSIKAKATATVEKAQKAIASQNPALIEGGGGNGPASYVALYCGQNQ